jgi:hypothetical protein
MVLGVLEHVERETEATGGITWNHSVKSVSYYIMYWYMYRLDTGLLPPCG